ncbi:MAG: SAM-dependent methyltransferase [Bacteroidota bacterium]
MKANTANRTAQYMALFRALETKRQQRLFTDPYAANFLNAHLQIVSSLSSSAFISNIISNIIQKKIPGAYTSGLARTKYIDDLLQQTITNGAQQVIILGAGFDTRALRLDYLRHTPVIEIDHPDTARLKINILKKRNGQLPANTRYLQIDFNNQSLDDLLKEHQINYTLPTTIIWEGVTNYLSREAIDATFTVLQKFANRSAVIFTYVHKQVLDNPSSFYGAQKLLQDLNNIEERWTFGFYPIVVRSYLNQFNFDLIHDKGAAEYRQLYIPERTSLNKGYEFYRVAFAQTKPR